MAEARARRPAWQGNDAAILKRLAEAEAGAPASLAVSLTASQITRPAAAAAGAVAGVAGRTGAVAGGKQSAGAQEEGKAGVAGVQAGHLGGAGEGAGSRPGNDSTAKTEASATVSTAGGDSSALASQQAKEGKGQQAGATPAGRTPITSQAATPGGGSAVAGVSGVVVGDASSPLSPASVGPRVAAGRGGGMQRVPWQPQQHHHHHSAPGAVAAAGGAAPMGWGGQRVLGQQQQQQRGVASDGDKQGVSGLPTVVDRSTATGSTHSQPLMHHPQHMGASSGGMHQHGGYNQHRHDRRGPQRVGGNMGGNRPYRSNNMRQAGSDPSNQGNSSGVPHSSTAPPNMGPMAVPPYMGAGQAPPAAASGASGALSGAPSGAYAPHGVFHPAAVPYGGPPGMRGMPMPMPIAGYPTFPSPPPVLLHNAAQLHEEVLGYAEEARPSREARVRVAEAVAKVRSTVKELWPGADVEVSWGISV